ncbi:hypothetical protein [Maricaulis maris]|jgi:hypothetical protein|uniref:hypothetical protein n=1 Tax=Maricaulis maris TaxID=74318 RepID=UPI00291EEB57|nr:hypothetical protein MACH15_29180 [Maricaulis maris]
MSNPFLYAAAAALIAAAAFFLVWLASRRSLMEDARAEYRERCETKPGTVRGVDEQVFERLYVSAHEPRGALYIAAALLLAVAITPLAGVGLIALWPYIVMTLDGGPWYDVGYYPWMFYMFFGLCGCWALAGAFVARIHHARTPESFHPALARARGEPLDDVVIPRKRPKWAVKARPDPAPDSAATPDS